MHTWLEPFFGISGHFVWMCTFREFRVLMDVCILDVVEQGSPFGHLLGTRSRRCSTPVYMILDAAQPLLQYFTPLFCESLSKFLDKPVKKSLNVVYEYHSLMS